MTANKNYILTQLKQINDYWCNSYLLAFFYMVILSDIRTSNEHDIQLGKMPERERECFLTIKLKILFAINPEYLFSCSLLKL